MLNALLDFARSCVGICPHEHFTWPRKGAGGVYIRCLDCGDALPYDWGAMRIVPPERGEVRREVPIAD